MTRPARKQQAPATALPKTRYAIRDRYGRYYVETDDGQVRWEPWALSTFPRDRAQLLLLAYAPSTRKRNGLTVAEVRR